MEARILSNPLEHLHEIEGDPVQPGLEIQAPLHEKSSLDVDLR
jgi:hypothetical protein